MRVIILLYIFLALSSVEAMACSVLRELTVAEKYEQAEDVFVARITSAKLVTNNAAKQEWDKEIIEAEYDVIEIFKGDAKPPVVREAVFGPGNCMLGLLVGNKYVFFIKGQDRLAGWPGGSFMVWNFDGKNVSPILEELRTLSNEQK